ncbi:MAG: hypothetical protein LBQ45_02460 [Mycoplasmataceae bacterium]|jgi:hypothetical protein|nr:hypothetical protein [Mycoplasmataceae bacterium]
MNKALIAYLDELINREKGFYSIEEVQKIDQLNDSNSLALKEYLHDIIYMPHRVMITRAKIEKIKELYTNA